MKTKKKTEKKNKQVASAPATPQETTLLSEIHSEISVAQILRDELEEEKEKLRGQNARLREKEKEIEDSIRNATVQLGKLNDSIREKTAAHSALINSIKEKEEILAGDFSDIVVPELWIKNTVNAAPFVFVNSEANLDFTVELLKVEVGLFGRTKTSKQMIRLFENIDKEDEEFYFNKIERVASAINQKITRRANLAPESAADYGADYDPLAEFKRQSKMT